MSKPTEIDIHDYGELLYSLRDKHHKQSTKGSIYSGIHPICGAKCSILKLLPRDDTTHTKTKYFVIKPHYRCSPARCLCEMWHECSQNHNRPLPRAMLKPLDLVAV